MSHDPRAFTGGEMSDEKKRVLYQFEAIMYEWHARLTEHQIDHHINVGMRVWNQSSPAFKIIDAMALLVGAMEDGKEQRQEAVKNGEFVREKALGLFVTMMDSSILGFRDAMARVVDFAGQFLVLAKHYGVNMEAHEQDLQEVSARHPAHRGH